jgi:curli biogenesis system outer membrane secretion channel CsgG
VKTLKPTLLALLIGVASCAVPPDSRTVTPEPIDSGTSVALQPPDGRFLKRKVAVARFSNETTYGKSVLFGEDVLVKQASDILNSRLAKTEKFILFDSEGADSKKVDADYKIIGSVSQFGRSIKGETGVFSKTKTQTAFAAVNLRVTSVRTGLVIFGAEGRGEADSTTGKVLGVGTADAFDSTLSEKAISAAISKVISNLVERLLDEPWQSYVLSIDGDKCIIAGGAQQGLMAGDKLSVLKRGEQVANPQTGIPIELPATPVAEIVVVSTFGENPLAQGSQCKVTSGTMAGVEAKDLTVRDKAGKSR